MAVIGFPKSKKKEEYRIALLPKELEKISKPENLWIVSGYGSHLGFSDSDYKRYGVKIVDDEKAYLSDIVCQPKLCSGDIPYLSKKQTIFGWTHLEPWWELTKKLAELEDTVIGWELMYKDGKYVFERNSYISGEVGVKDAIERFKKIPDNIISHYGGIENLKIALIGNGNVGKGARYALKRLGASDSRIDIYNSKNVSDLWNSIEKYDIVINAASVKKDENGKYIYPLTREHMRKMKSGAVLLDLGMSIKYPIKTKSIEEPIKKFNEDKNLIYVNDHIPTLDPLRASKVISKAVSPYINLLLNDKMDETLRNAIIIDEGKINYDRLSY
jgi:alanine dehydrogenase